jgi:hypothetical protein
MEAGLYAVVTGSDTDMTQKSKTYVFKVNTTNNFGGENCEYCIHGLK